MRYETDIFPSIDRIDNLIATPSEVRKKEIQNEGLRNAEQIIVEIATLKRRMIDFSCPSIVQGEYNIICRETKKLTDDVIGLDKLKEYLQKQLIHLQSIQQKIGSSSIDYIRISTFIVEASILKIRLARNYEETHAHSVFPDYMPPLYQLPGLRNIYLKAWDGFKIMDSFAIEYEYKYDHYDKEKEYVKNQCKRAAVETRTSSEKVIDASKHVAEETLGCIIQAAIVILIGFILSMIFVKH